MFSHFHRKRVRGGKEQAKYFFTERRRNRVLLCHWNLGRRKVHGGWDGRQYHRYALMITTLVIHKAHSHISEGESFCSKETCLIWLSTAFSQAQWIQYSSYRILRDIQKHQSSPTSNTQQNQNDVPDPPTINAAFFQYIIPNALNSAGEQHYINLNVGNVKHPRQLELEITMRSAHIWSVSEPPRVGYPWLLPSQEEEQRDK